MRKQSYSKLHVRDLVQTSIPKFIFSALSFWIHHKAHLSLKYNILLYRATIKICITFNINCVTFSFCLSSYFISFIQSLDVRHAQVKWEAIKWTSLRLTHKSWRMKGIQPFSHRLVTLSQQRLWRTKLKKTRCPPLAEGHFVPFAWWFYLITSTDASGFGI